VGSVSIQGLRYGDGRIICTACHHTAVKHDLQLQVIWGHVKTCFAELGLAVNWGRLPVRLQHQSQMSRAGGSSQVVGIAEHRIAGRQVDSKVTLLYGMPAALAVETLAHESGHVWCREHHIEFSPDAAQEEGFCNVLGCLALKRLGDQYDAPNRIESMFRNTDPVYGGSFREQWSAMRAVGWSSYKILILQKSVCA
jgi:hypothetical protein